MICLLWHTARINQVSNQCKMCCKTKTCAGLGIAVEMNRSQKLESLIKKERPAEAPFLIRANRFLARRIVTESPTPMIEQNKAQPFLRNRGGSPK